MHDNQPHKIRPATVRNRILHVLSVHGIEAETAQSVYFSLTTGNDPRPANLPVDFVFHGIKLCWPSGVGTRIINDNELNTINKALKLNRNEPLDDDVRAFQARDVYSALFHMTQRPEYVDRNSKAAADANLAEIVAEILTAEEQLLYDIFTGNDDDPLVRYAGEPMIFETQPPIENPLCGDLSPSRKICLRDPHHEGKHKNGRTTWNGKNIVIDVHTTDERTIKNQPTSSNVPAEPVSDFDQMLADLAKITQSL